MRNGGSDGTRTRHVLGKAGASFQRASQTSDVGLSTRSERRDATDCNNIIYAELENWKIHSGPFWTPIGKYPKGFQYVGEV
jgi:hypothetical protein